MTASFILSALLVVVGGFCYGLTAKAAMENMHAGMAAISQNCHGQHGQEIAQKNVPLKSDSVMPCCVDRHDGVPSVETTNFSGITKFATVQMFQDSTSEISLVENKLKTSSDSSPPKPDKLSSVLRLE